MLLNIQQIDRRPLATSVAEFIHCQFVADFKNFSRKLRIFTQTHTHTHILGVTAHNNDINVMSW